ncbi:MAG: D-alanyl-D-alanine carboxypeptidase [Ruminococcus sp.]|nr:D-alanyl-D-alanine carboxypeptidase [Ruminococcus sp.]
MKNRRHIMKKFLSVLTVAMLLAVPLRVYAENPVPEVSARACVLIEEKTGKILFEKNSAEKLPMASTTKIMTTLLCIESGGLDDEFVVDSSAIKVEGSSMGLVEGDVVTKRSLCYGMLLPSGNDAANAAAVKIGGSIEEFAEMMNERAEQIGMTRTCFVTPSGLEGEGHGSSAYDMALLAREALKNPVFAEICSETEAKVRFGNPPYDRWLKNTNKLLTMYDGVKGVKTGFTDEAGRCLVSACERDGVSLVCVTLNDKNDWEDHSRMYDYGFSNVTSAELSSDEIYPLTIVGGTEETIPVKAQGSITIGDDGKLMNKISSEIIMPPFVYTNIKLDDKVGEMRWYYDGRYIGSLDITAMKNARFESVEKSEKNILEKIKDFLFNN